MSEYDDAENGETIAPRDRRRKADDVFGFNKEKAKPAELSWTKEEIKKWGAAELMPYLCKEGDKDWKYYITYLQKELFRNPPLCTLGTKAVLMRLRAQTPKRKVHAEEQEKLDAEYKVAIEQFKEICLQEFNQLARNNLLGTLGRYGELRFLEKQGVIKVIGDDYRIKRDGLERYHLLTARIKSYRHYTDTVQYAKQQEIIGLVTTATAHLHDKA